MKTSLTALKIILRQDSRDRHVLDHFSSPSSLPNVREFDRGLTNPVESPSDVDCTAIDLTDVATDQTGVVYSIPDAWALTPQSAGGADPRDSMGVIVHHGLQPVSGGVRDTRWISYMRAEGNSGDYTLNTKLSMEATQSSTTANTYWYAEWNNVGNDGVLPQGVTKVSGHSYKISGWEGDFFHVKHWLGYMVWMPKDVYNTEMAKYGTSAFIPTTAAIQKTQKTYIQSVIDFVVNQCIAIQRQILLLRTN